MRRVVYVDPTTKKVTYIRESKNNRILNENEEFSDIANLGQIKQQDGSFSDDIEEIERNNKELRKQELIELMKEANALQDQALWQTYKDEYDSL